MIDPFSALRDEHPGRFASPERIAQLSRERFVPLPACKPGIGKPLPKCKYADGTREPKR